MPLWFTTKEPTPVLNTPRFKEVYGEALPFDLQGLVRALEYISFPHRTFTVLRHVDEHILQVSTPAYPSTTPMYVDRRFGIVGSVKEAPCRVRLPTKSVLIDRLLAKRGLPYVWGGNWSQGLFAWERWYPPPPTLSLRERVHWTLRGVDCSGLLHEVTEGLTPRNVSHLMKYGVEVEGSALEPLDLILYPGHVLIALNRSEVIESSLALGGVAISPLSHRLSVLGQGAMFRRIFQTLQDSGEYPV